MTAISFDAVGQNPRVRVIATEALVVPNPGQVLIDVHAAAVNFADVLLRRGEYEQAPATPFVPGSEVAGDVLAVGKGICDLAPGDRVIALTPNGIGGYAERVLADAGSVYRLPAGVEYEAGAAFLLTFLTAWIPLRRQVVLGPGSSALVHAGAGGVGSATIQLLHHLGVDVFATAGGAEKCRRAEQIGATRAFDYSDREALVPLVREATGNRGVDVVIDPVGGDLTALSVKLLAPLGTVVMIGYAGGAWPSIDPALLVGRNAGIAGIFLGRLMKLDPALVRALGEELIKLLAAGSVLPLVGATLELGRADEALDLLEQRQTVGKIVLTP